MNYPNNINYNNPNNYNNQNNMNYPNDMNYNNQNQKIDRRNEQGKKINNLNKFVFYQKKQTIFNMAKNNDMNGNNYINNIMMNNNQIFDELQSQQEKYFLIQIQIIFLSFFL